MRGQRFIDAIKKSVYIIKVPSYGNKIFYSLGFLALTCFALLTVSGLVMVFEGSSWWLANPVGMFFRSIHLWSAQAFVFLILMHFLIVFLTSGFKKPRRFTWVLGALMFLTVLVGAEFGYALRGDFSSQYRALQAADFWNGSYLGHVINVLNHAQVFGIHIVIIPLILLALAFSHYLLVKVRGIAKPYRSDVKYRMVRADHNKLFLRGGVLVACIILFAILFPSPLVKPVSVKQVAEDAPALFAQTLTKEFNHTSDTATYLDSIDPYTYDTRDAYVTVPYHQYLAVTGGPDELGGATTTVPVAVLSSLTRMAQSGLYQSAIDAEQPNTKPMYSLRFLVDTGVLDAEAKQLHITTEEWGMMREESGAIPPGAWWLSPIGLLNHTVLAHDPNGDRDGAEILGILALLFILFPYIPYLNRLPEKLNLAPRIWKTR